MGTAVGVPLSTRETVDWETPVASAMSRMVGTLAVGRLVRAPAVADTVLGLSAVCDTILCPPAAPTPSADLV